MHIDEDVVWTIVISASAAERSRGTEAERGGREEGEIASVEGT